MTQQKVLYIHDNPSSPPVQAFIAQTLSTLCQEGASVIAFGFHPYGKIPTLPEEVYQKVWSSEPLEILKRGSRNLSMDSSQLLQVLHRQEILESKLELWGVEDARLLSTYQRTQQEHWRFQEQKKRYFDASREQMLTLEAQLEELKRQRIPAIVANTHRIITEKKIPFLPLVMGYAEYLEISQKLQERGIGVISYEG